MKDKGSLGSLGSILSGILEGMMESPEDQKKKAEGYIKATLLHRLQDQIHMCGKWVRSHRDICKILECDTLQTYRPEGVDHHWESAELWGVKYQSDRWTELMAEHPIYRIEGINHNLLGSMVLIEYGPDGSIRSPNEFLNMDLAIRTMWVNNDFMIEGYQKLGG